MTNVPTIPRDARDDQRNRTRTLFISLIVWLVSIGWLAPLFLSASSFWRWIETEAAPVVYGQEPAVNSFPFLYFSQRYFWMASIWGALVFMGWTAYLLARLGADSSRRG